MTILGLQLDVVAVTAFLASLAALVGVPFLAVQTLAARRATQLQAIQTLWGNFDDSHMRDYRRSIHASIPPERDKRPPPANISKELWDAIEVTATAMDRVGSLIAHDLVDEDLIFERYSEVIIPLWEKLQPYLDYRRGGKGSGWRFFGPLPSVAPTGEPRDLYTRAVRYKARKHPTESYSTFKP